MVKLKEKNLKITQAERIRQACIKAAQEGFMDASMSGLCTEGAMEAAISRIQMLDLDKVIKQDS